MGEYEGILLVMMIVAEESGRYHVSIPETGWELTGSQPVAMMNAAFEQIKEIPGSPIADNEEVEDDTGLGYAPTASPTAMLLKYRDTCFDHLPLFSMAENLKANLGTDLAGIGFGIDECWKEGSLPNPLYTVLYWKEDVIY